MLKILFAEFGDLPAAEVALNESGEFFGVLEIVGMSRRVERVGIGGGGGIGGAFSLV